MFLVGSAFWGSLVLTIFILICILITLIISKILSKTILKEDNVNDEIAIELPPYRRPQICKILYKSIFDKTLKILYRAVIVSIPVGIIIWIMANININEISILTHCTNFFEPLGKIMGLDGVILMAFILGLPANEIVLPIMIMTYLGGNTLIEMENLTSLKSLLLENGWNIKTAICTIIFSMIHYPCATTLLTIKDETKSKKYTLLSFIIPTAIGAFICIVIEIFYNLIYN